MSPSSIRRRDMVRSPVISAFLLFSAAIVGCEGGPKVDVQNAKKASAEGGLQLNPAAKVNKKGATLKGIQGIQKPKE